jgi:hypothetical protein
MKSSGKKEGIGGIEAFITNSTPTRAENNLIFLEKTKGISRDLNAWAKVPDIKNRPIEAQPWAKDNRATLK